MNIDNVKIKEAINSFLDKKIDRIKPVHKYSICIISILVPCLVFYFVSYSPKADEIKKLQIQQKNLEIEIAKIEKAASEITKYRAEMEETELMFSKASALLPQQQEIPSLLASISDVGQNSGLVFLSFTPKNEIKKDFYADIPVDVKVRGAYHNVGTFLDKISNLPRIVTVSDINMGGPKLQGGEIILETTFSLVTYRFIESIPQANDKKESNLKP
jgi:type IV pilus assembly protein PilO